MFRKLAWQLTTSYILVILCSMGILGFYMLSELEDNFTHDAETSVRQQAMLVASTWSNSLEEGQITDRERRRLASLARQLSLQYGTRLRVLNLGGKVIAEAGEGSDPDLATRPAVVSAFKGEAQTVEEPDPTDPSVNQVSIAYPIMVRRPDSKDEVPKESVQGVVYVSRSTTYLRFTLHTLQKIFLFATVISLMISGLLSLFMSHYITHPLRAISKAADQLARGDLGIQVPASRLNEIGELAARFNYMARQLSASTGLVLEEKNKLAAVLAHMADGVLMMDTKGNTLVMNPSAVEMLRRAAAFEGRPEAERLLREGLVRAVQVNEELNEEIPLDGGRIARAVYSPVRAEGGDVVGYVVILHDITELRRLAELKTEFVSNVSHELKTPLASIKGLAEILLDGALQEQDGGRRFLVSIGREVDRMARLVRDLLNLSKIESGVVKMETQPFDLGRLVDETAIGLQTRASGHGVKIEVALHDAPLWATGDTDRVEQVVVNLLDNALRYSPSDSTIHVEVRRDDGMCRVDVVDQGIGLSYNDLERIFQRFYRVDKARTREKGGTGLGLAIARQIVDRLGGRIWATSEGEGKGSCFSFTLPTAAPDQPDEAALTTRAAAEGSV